MCLSVCVVATCVAAPKQPMKKLTHDPNLPAVDLFDAMEDGTIETTVIAKNSNEASLFVTNRSSAAVSVRVPRAVVAVQVLKQLFPPVGRTPGGGFPGGTTGTGMGQAQPIGGGPQNNNANPNVGVNNQQGNGFNNMIGNGNGVGNGFFSVPSQKTVQVPLKTVCLAHARPDPRPRMKYRLVKLEDYTHDPVLQQTLEIYVTGEVEVQAAQAAVWHLTDKMSWNDLRSKQIERLGGVEPLPYFTDKQVDLAEKLIEQAREKTNDRPRRTETAAK
jgi:hypothetical protein